MIIINVLLSNYRLLLITNSDVIATENFSSGKMRDTICAFENLLFS